MIMMVIMIIILMNIITMMRSKIRHKLSQTDSTTLKMFTNFLFSRTQVFYNTDNTDNTTSQRQTKTNFFKVNIFNLGEIKRKILCYV